MGTRQRADCVSVMVDNLDQVYGLTKLVPVLWTPLCRGIRHPGTTDATTRRNGIGGGGSLQVGQNEITRSGWVLLRTQFGVYRSVQNPAAWVESVLRQ